MYPFKKCTIFIIASIITLLSLSTCKKYPENVTWFKIAKWHCPINGYITEYKVNGIDSLDLLNKYYNLTSLKYPINGFKYEVKKEGFGAEKYNNKGVFRLPTELFRKDSRTYDMRVEWDKARKNITVKSYDPDTFYYKKNIFIESNHTWKVMCLDKNGKSKIKTTFNNGNTYEITFEK